jgi:hypothetical protein
MEFKVGDQVIDLCSEPDEWGLRNVHEIKSVIYAHGGGLYVLKDNATEKFSGMSRLRYGREIQHFKHPGPWDRLDKLLGELV